VDWQTNEAGSKRNIRNILRGGKKKGKRKLRLLLVVLPGAGETEGEAVQRRLMVECYAAARAMRWQQRVCIDSGR
jgi:hypothetical protein